MRLLHVPKWSALTSSMFALAGVLLMLLSPTFAFAQDDTLAARNSVRVFLPNDHNLQWLTFWAALGAVQALFNGSADLAVLRRPLYLNAVAQARPVRAFANLIETYDAMVRRAHEANADLLAEIARSAGKPARKSSSS